MARRTLAWAYRDTALCKRQKDSANAIIVIVRIFFVNLSYFDQKQLPRFWFASRLQRAVVPGFTDFHNPAHGINAEPLTEEPPQKVILRGVLFLCPVFNHNGIRDNLIFSNNSLQSGIDCHKEQDVWLEFYYPRNLTRFDGRRLTLLRLESP